MHPPSTRLACQTVAPDEQTVVSGSVNGIVWVWERDGDRWWSVQLTGHGDPVNSEAVSADGWTVVSCSDDQLVRLWERDGDQREELSQRGMEARCTVWR